MTTVILVIHLLIALSMITLILLQKSEGFASGGGMMGGASLTGMTQARSRANPLTRATAILGISFFATSLTLALLAKPNQESTVILSPSGLERPVGAPIVDIPADFPPAQDASKPLIPSVPMAD